MRTYLVIPDDANGGSAWEVLVRAITPQEAVERASEDKAFGLDGLQVLTQVDINHGDGAHWVVRELPFLLNERGVVPWDKFPVTFFELGEHEDAPKDTS